MKVFISHAYKDEPLVKKLTAKLENAGFEVWDATRDVRAGEEWSEQVDHALEDSDAMVAILSADALRSSWVRHEIEYALGEPGYRRRLIPVLVGDSQELSKEDVPWILRHLNMIDMDEHDEESGISKIVQVLSDNAVTDSHPASPPTS